MQLPGNEELMGQLSLSDELSIERTRLANDRTLLSFIRTSLYFSVAGMTITSLINFEMDWLVAIIFYAISVFIFVLGFIRYFKLRNKLRSGAFGNELFRAMLHEEE
jgi:putative membrane protein